MLINTASSIFFMVSSESIPMHFFNRDFSIVRICSSIATESLSGSVSLLMLTWVGNLECLSLVVIGAIIVVVEYVLPMSFCMMTTGRLPPCSQPTTGLRLAKYTSPRFTIIWTSDEFLLCIAGTAKYRTCRCFALFVVLFVLDSRTWGKASGNQQTNSSELFSWESHPNCGSHRALPSACDGLRFWTASTLER